MLNRRHMQNPDGPQFRSTLSRLPAKFGPYVLFLIPFTISVSPRIHLPILFSGDFRVQDFVVIGVASALVLRDVRRMLEGRAIIRSTALILFATAILLTSALSHAIQQNTLSATVVSLGMAYRLILLLLIVFTFFRLVQDHGTRGLLFASYGLMGGMFINLVFFVSQLIVGPLKPFSFSPTTPAMYGPGLIGEGAVFNVGGYWFVALCFGVTVTIFAPSIWIRATALSWSFFVAFALYEVNSRASMVAAAAVLFLVAVTFIFKALRRDWRVQLLAVGALLIGCIFLLGLLVPRAGLIKVLPAIARRWGRYSIPAIEDMTPLDHYIGRGLGGTRFMLSAETHNLYLALVGDFGLVGLAAFLLSFLAVFTVISQSFRRAEADRLMRMIAVLSFFSLLFVPVAGLVQDSHLPVLPTQLVACILGAFFGVYSRELPGYRLGWWGFHNRKSLQSRFLTRFCSPGLKTSPSQGT